VGVNRVFLATTALEDFWDANQQILFLGTWCLLQKRRARWESLRYRALPCPWNDRRRFYQAADQADASYERLLTALADYLNGAHRVSLSSRYWRIVVGPWLWHFVQAVHDRLAHLEDAFRIDPALTTSGIAPGAMPPPGDTMALVDALSGDAYNLQLCSDLLRSLGHEVPTSAPPPAEFADFSNDYHSAAATSFNAVLRRTAKRTLIRLNRHRWRVAMYGMYMQADMVRTLAIGSRFRALRIDDASGWSGVGGGRLENGPNRRGLASLAVSDRIDRITTELLPRHFPPLYLEGFARARAHVIDHAPEPPAVTVSSIGWMFDEPFKLFAGEAVQKGRRLLATQHGGGYGLYRCNSAERHERALSDCFLVWGWADAQTPGCRNVPAPKFGEVRGAATAPISRTAPLLFVATEHPRYLFRFHSNPVGSQWPEYMAWQRRFLAALPEPVLPSVRFRPYAYDYGHGIRAAIASAFPAVAIDNTSPFAAELRAASVVVIDNFSTTSLESLAANVPTVLFWDPERWECRAEAESALADLRSCGILWNDPEQAAAHIAVIRHDPRRWWNEPSLQAARSRFVARYALNRADWATHWLQAFDAESAS
jgi:putative transferase (TIGR04331 family)